MSPSLPFVGRLQSMRLALRRPVNTTATSMPGNFSALNAASSCRLFYTANVPKDTRSIVLEDGSTLIFLNKMHEPAKAKSAESEAPSSGRTSSPGSIKRSNLSAVPAAGSPWPTVALSDPQTDRTDQGGRLDTAATAALPPRVREFPKRAWLSKEQIQQMRELRSSDPDTWTVGRLVEKFGTFPGFVLRMARCPPERSQMLADKAQADFDNSPVSAKLRAVNRLRRKELW